ncbi:MAG: L,D-transpeptidase [Roseiarcus sp.]|jgi:lipoprotein-anchoring transpeptidase ErfK/SrfK
MRHIPSLATFALAGLVATSAAEAAGGGGRSILRAPQVLVSDEQPIADPAPREVVDFSGPQKPGTVIINTSERRLYYVLPDQQAIKYGVGVGRPGFEWTGVEHIASKREWPDWTPPSQMLKRRPDLPRHMAGGIDNPLGARAMYLSGTLYRIHGSNEPDTIGQAVSSGCIRMTNDDVVDLYNRAKIGATVIVMR